jgi:Zinc carboxypeptidase
VNNAQANPFPKGMEQSVRAIFDLVAIAVILASGFFAARSAVGQTANDEGYTNQIRKYTTEPYFDTSLVDHLPKSASVPTPQQFLGYIVGAPGHLTYSKDIYAYYRALAKASPRVKVFSAGRSEEGREFLLVAVSSAANIAQLDRYRGITAKLADPRTISSAQAQEMEEDGKPLYWVSGSIHSPETGSPEMLMELAYRIAVEDTPFIQNIRKNTILLITPMVEVDGHDRMVDVFHYHDAYPNKPTPNLIYWGHYVAHDNNRDGIGMGLALTRMMMREFLYFHPQVLHDLHESVPYLYISTGTGPYNAWLDPMTISEWEKYADNEVEKFSENGVFGVWTHGYYDGWAPNYMFYIANGHNSIGRFYETFGNMYPDTRKRLAEGDRPFRTWFRANPPLRETLWSLRDNTNLEESGLLFALDYTAKHRQEALSEFYLKSKRAIEKATTEGPAAWAIESGDRPALAAELARLLQQQGVEVDRLNSDFQIRVPSASPIGQRTGMPQTAGPSTASATADSGRDDNATDATGPAATSPSASPARTKELQAGTYIIRMDQPYSRMADMLLDTQYYSIHDPTPYDDTGWTLGPLFDVSTDRIVDPSILRAPMNKIQGDAKWTGGGIASEGGAGGYFIINANAEPGLATLRFRLPDVKLFAANRVFNYGGKKFNAGSFIVPADGNPENLQSRLNQTTRELGLKVYAGGEKPNVAEHPIPVPRIAILHTWTDTQNEGWFRMAFDRCGVPYSYISTTLARTTPDLRKQYDVILIPPVEGGAAAILNGIPKRTLQDGTDSGGPIPWEKTALTPNIGTIDHAADIRGGLGFQGLANLKQFVEQGGLLIAVGSSSQMATQFGFAPGVRITRPAELHAKGGIFRAHVESESDPVTYGYPTDVPVYFDQSPVFQVSVPTSSFSGGYFSPDRMVPRTSGRGSENDPDVPQGRPWIPEAAKAQLTRIQRETYVDPEALLDSGDYIAPESLWPRVVLRFVHQNLLVSGMLTGGKALEDVPAIVDVPEGGGHVLLFANNPMWRQETGAASC